MFRPVPAGTVMKIAAPIGILLLILSFRFDDMLNGVWAAKLAGIVLCIVIGVAGNRIQKKAKEKMQNAAAAPV